MCIVVIIKRNEPKIPVNTKYVLIEQLFYLSSLCANTTLYKAVNLRILSWLLQIPYNGNHLRKKSFANCLLCRSSQENIRDSGNLII